MFTSGFRARLDHKNSSVGLTISRGAGSESRVFHFGHTIVRGGVRPKEAVFD
jgi:hypothetical protein